MDKFFTLALVLAFTILPASADLVAYDGSVHDNVNPGTEMDLFEIYNALYGSTFNSTAVGSNSMDAYMGGILINPAEVFELIANAENGARFRARFASYNQAFGYVNDINSFSGPGDLTGDPLTGTGDYTHLFNASPNGLDTSDSPWSQISGASPIAFYDYNPNNQNTWWSIASWNPDSAGFTTYDHMVAYWAIDGQGNVQNDTFIIAFEDSPHGGSRTDWDYNDLVVEVHIPVTPPPVTEVPEPATITLLGLGLVGFALRRKRF